MHAEADTPATCTGWRRFSLRQWVPVIAPSADAVRAKLDWANGHHATLTEELQSWCSSEESLIEIVVQTSDCIVFHILPKFRRPDLFTRWGLMVGDTLTNYRDTLDHAVYHMVSVRMDRPLTEKEAESISFPLGTKEASYAELERRRFVATLSPEARKLIRSVQPFKDTGKLWTQNLLRITNWSKHRVLPVAAFYPEGPPQFTLHTYNPKISLTDYEVRANRIFVEGEPFALLGFSEPCPLLRVAPSLTFLPVLQVPGPTADWVYVEQLIQETKFQVERVVHSLLAMG